MSTGDGDDLQVEGPVIDEETGVHSYLVRGPGGEVSFGVIPEPSPDGVTNWVMRLGSDQYVMGEFSFEPYESPQEAFAAGMRAVRQIFQPHGGSA